MAEREDYAAKLRTLANENWPIIIAFQMPSPGQLLIGEVHEGDVADDGWIPARHPALILELEDKIMVMQLKGFKEMSFINPLQYTLFGLADSPYLEHYLEWKRHHSR